MGLLRPIWNYVDALVPAAAQQDALTPARYRAFIAPRLVASLLAFAGLPIYVVIRGAPNAMEFVIFAWLAVPIFIVYFLAKTARYETAYLLSSSSMICAASFVAAYSGGVTSSVAVWLVMVPLEAAQAGSRRVVLGTSIISLAVVGLLLLLGADRLLPSAEPETQSAIAVLSLVLASLYATSLAFGSAYLSRSASRLLRDEERRYLLLARNMTDVIFRHDRNGNVRFASPTANVLFGIPARDLTGHGLFDRVHIVDRPAYLTALSDVANLGVERSLEIRIRCEVDAHRHGQYVWVDMRCRPLADSVDEENREIVSNFRDASERKSQEQSIESAQDESDRARDAKGRFIAAVSHELRTPLTAIIGFSEIIMSNGSDLSAARRTEYARLINTSGRHLLEVVNGVLDVSSLESGQFSVVPESFAAGPIIEDCANMLALRARETGVEIKLHLDRLLPDLAADRRAFNQILINLVSNAIKFSRREGQVTIAASCEGSRFVLSVEDTGVGIAESDLPQIGEAFFRPSASSDRHYEGSGLGLSIVKGLVKLHGGAIDITSRVNEGTHVKVWLPLEQAQCAARVPLKAVENASPDLRSTTKDWMKKSA